MLSVYLKLNKNNELLAHEIYLLHKKLFYFLYIIQIGNLFCVIYTF